MSDNKTRGKLDYRNIKSSQFNGSQIEKMEFSELNSAKRVLQTNNILKDSYTHFTQELDVSNRPTKISYYQALDSTIDKITFRADVSGDLAGTYYTIENPVDQKLYVIYQVVNAVGSPPGIGDVEIAATYNDNDSSILVAYANRQALNTIEDFVVINKGVLDNFADIEYIQFGEADAIDLGTTGFSTTRSKPGDSLKIAEVELDYDSDGNILFQDQVLKGAVYDAYRASFNFPTTANLKDENGDAYSPSNPLHVQLSDGSVNIGTVNAELEVQLSRKDNDPDAGDVHDAVRIGNQDVELGFNDLGDGTGEAKVEARGFVGVDPLNSSDIPLNDTDVFTGQWVKRTTPTLIAAISSDTDLDFRLEFSTDGVTATDSSLPYTYTANAINVPRRLVIAREYYRVKVTNNSGSNQTYFRLQTSIGDFAPLASKLNAGLSIDADAEVVRAVGAGQQSDGDYVNNKADGGAVDINGVTVLTDVPLGVSQQYQSGWIDSDGFKSIEVSIETDQISADNGIIVEYTSDVDVITPTVLITKVFSYTQSNADSGDLTILIPPRLDGFRVTYINGLTVQSNFHLEVTLRTGPMQSVSLPLDSPIVSSTNAGITRSIISGNVLDRDLIPTGGYANTELTSNRSLKTQQVHETIFQYTRPTDPAIPSGSSIVIDPVLNSESNVVDSGWLSVSEFKTQDFHILADQGMSIFLLNASDTLGNNRQGEFFPALISSANNPASISARFFDTHFRIIMVNTSGSTINSISARSTGGNGTIQPIDISIDQDIFSFFPAPLIQAISKGQAPDGSYNAIPMGGVDTQNTTADNLGAAGTFVGEYQSLKGYSSGLFFAISSAPLDEIRLQYSPDGVNPSTSLLGTSSFVASEVELGGFYIYISVVTTFIDNFFRLEVTNGATPTFIFEADSWLYDKPYTGSFGNLTDDLSTLSIAALNRSVIAGTDPVGNFKNLPAAGNAYTFRGTLLADATDISQIIDTEGYGAFSIVGFSDVVGEVSITWSDSADMSTNIASASFPVAAGGPRTLHLGPPQGKYVQVSYQNGAFDSGVDQIYYAFDLSPAQIQLPLFTIGAPLAAEQASIIAKGPIEALDDAASYGQIGRVLDALKVSVSEINAEISTKPSNGIYTTQLNVPSGSSIQIPPPPLSKLVKPRSLSIKNMCADIDVFLGDINVTALNGDIIQQFPENMIFGDNDGYEDLYLIAEQGAGNETFTELPADTVDSNSGVLNPSNVFALDASYATLDSNSDTMSISGFDSSLLPPSEDIQSVFLKAVARKQVGAGKETSAFVDVVGATAGNVTSITSPTAIANVNQLYMVTITRRDEFALINSLTNTMGFTGFTLVGDTGTASSESRTSTYYMTGTPTSDGTITANFSQGADYCNITVTRFSGIDLTNPINSVTTLGANNSGGSYSGSLTSGEDKGQYYIGMGFEQGRHTTPSTPSGAVERIDIGATGGNQQTQAVITAPLTSTGAVSFSGTCSGSADISYVAVTLNPADSLDPTATISHSEGATNLVVQTISSSATLFSQDISTDTTFTGAILDGMVLTISGTSIGSAAIEFDYVYLEIFTSNSTTRVAIKWLGDKP